MGSIEGFHQPHCLVSRRWTILSLIWLRTIHRSITHDQQELFVDNSLFPLCLPVINCQCRFSALKWSEVYSWYGSQSSRVRHMSNVLTKMGLEMTGYVVRKSPSFNTRHKCRNFDDTFAYSHTSWTYDLRRDEINLSKQPQWWLISFQLSLLSYYHPW